MQTIHDLKCWPEFFDAIVLGGKRWEFRLNDRDFRIGHVLRLCEWEPSAGEYTGAQFLVYVDSVWKDLPGLPAGYCVMDITPVHKNVARLDIAALVKK